MKIIDKRIQTETDFCKIKLGGTFSRQLLNHILMKTETVCDEEGELLVNAVDLCDGTLYAFDSMDKVIPVECECIITNSKES